MVSKQSESIRVSPHPLPATGDVAPNLVVGDGNGGSQCAVPSWPFGGWEMILISKKWPLRFSSRPSCVHVLGLYLSGCHHFGLGMQLAGG